MSERPGLLSFNEFWAFVVQSLRLDCGSIGETSLISEELGVDSLQMIELVLLMDDMGAELLEDLIPNIATAGDLYHHYATRVSAESCE